MAFTWVFVRGIERLEIQRSDSPTATQLVVEGDGGERRVYDFNDHAELVTFHGGFEEDLVRDGWALLEFLPERRRGTDRRQSSREAERRRFGARVTRETSGV